MWTRQWATIMPGRCRPSICMAVPPPYMAVPTKCRKISSPKPCWASRSCIMNFNLSEEQNLLADSVTRFIGNDYGYDIRKKHVALPDGFDRATWATFAELGWLCVPFSEEDGGIGGGPLQTMIMMESFGKGLVVEPYVSCVVLAGSVLKRAGNPGQKAELIGGIIDGSRLLTLAYLEPQSRFDLFDVKTNAKRDGDRFILNGTKAMVLHGGAADKIGR